ncbi:AMIN domain-containing protein [Paracoccus sp. S-4012]|nr:AMIN domain-containing protein [Paracoccus sp. S-4012]
MLALLVLLCAAPLAAAEAPRLDLAASSLAAEGKDRGEPRPLALTLVPGGAVPYRAMLLDGPPRLVLDLQGVGLSAAEPTALPGAALVPAIRWGAIAGDRVRIVLELPSPMAIDRAVLTGTGPAARLSLRLVPVAPEDFAPEARGDALPLLFDLPDPAPLPPAIARAPGALRVTLDPGHGGFDPGAVAGGITEAALMLTVANEIAAALRAKGVEVTLTRDGDRFVPLERRMTVARSAHADLLISLHADVLPEGEAAGAAVFLWDPEGDDRAAAELALRHDRDDLLAGLDLAGADDEVAATLMDIARLDTQPRSENISKFLLSEFALGRIAIRNRPVKGAAFSVLKSPDIPSVLVETGFLSDAGDRANLLDPQWRAGLAGAVARAVVAWAEDDAARAPLLRR